MLFLLLACADPPSPKSTGTNADVDADGVEAPADCDDLDPAVHPGAAERCDGVDEDCDGAVDEEPVDGARFVEDADGDGFGARDGGVEVVACSAPTGFAPSATDCDDLDPDVSPVATEVCDGVDDDCDGTIDVGAADARTYYRDEDADGVGAAAVEACAAPDGAVERGGDCADDDPSRHPGAEEVCDEVDQDCDGLVDDEPVDAPTWYLDLDGDGYGSEFEVVDCDPGFGWSLDGGDCADADAGFNPGAAEYCNGLDEDCDGVADDGAPGSDPSWFDADRDGYGDPDTLAFGCGVLPGHVADATDCDDQDPDSFPGAEDLCDGVDQDCSGDEDGLVSVEVGGVRSDDTATWSAGTASSPAAIAAPAGAVYRVCPGTYWVAVEESGGVEIDGPYGRDVTTLAGGAGVRPLTSNLATTLSGVTVVGSTVSGSGGAVYASGWFWAVDVVLASGSADTGGNLACDGCIATLEGSVVQDGTATEGGGIWVAFGSLGLTDTTVPRGLATDGGGVWALESAVGMVRGEIASSSASGLGGGLYAESSVVDLLGALLSGNDAAEGGGVWAGGGTTIALEGGAILFDNSAAVGGGAALDGADGSCVGSGVLEGVFGNLGCGLSLGAGSTFDSTACDWLGTTDNAPHDVCDAAGGAWDYGDDATFALP